MDPTLKYIYLQATQSTQTRKEFVRKTKGEGIHYIESIETKQKQSSNIPYVFLQYQYDENIVTYHHMT